MSVHIHQLLYVQQKEQEKKKSKREERKLYCSSQDVAEPSLIFLIVNVSPVGAQFWRGKQQVLFLCVCLFVLVNSSCLLLEHINCIFILHFQLQQKREKRLSTLLRYLLLAGLFLHFLSPCLLFTQLNQPSPAPLHHHDFLHLTYFTITQKQRNYMEKKVPVNSCCPRMNFSA